MKFGEFVSITLISGIAGIIIGQLILPVFALSVEKSLEDLSLIDFSNLISWSAIALTFMGLILTLFFLSGSYHFKPLFRILLLSLFFSIIILCSGSFVFLRIFHPELFFNASSWVKIIKFLSYPTMVSLVLEDPQPIWIISECLFLIIFNLTVKNIIK